MDIVKMTATAAQSVPPTTPTQLNLPTTLISKGGSSLAPSINSIQVLQAGYYLVTIEAQVIGTHGTAGHKISLGRGNGFNGSSTETLEFTGTASGVNYGRTLIIKASAGSFLFVEAVNPAGANRDYQVSLAVARLAGA